MQTDERRVDAVPTPESLEWRREYGDYNYRRFRTKHFLYDAQVTREKRGATPGEMAPDFELPCAGGGSLRLSDLRGRPVLLHFGSPS